MKKNNLKNRIFIFGFVLLLLTTAGASWTLAKYTTSVSGQATATIAKWSFKANGSDGTSEFKVDLNETSNQNVASGKIAPGSSGSFDIEIDASGSETALDYKIEFSDITDPIANLKFYQDAEHKQEISDLTTTTALNGTIAVSETKNKVIKTVYWEWKEGSDAADTAIGLAGGTMTFKIKVTGTQKIDVTQAP